MEIEFSKDLYIDQCALFFNFLLQKRQWSGITTADYMRWIKNFDSVEDGKYIGTRILDSLLYYSEDDLIQLLDDVIMGVFEQEVALPLQIEKHFSCLPSEIEYAVTEAISKTIVVPAIEDMMDPGASGPEIIRHVRNHFRPQVQSTFNQNLVKDASYERLIIIDDCIGSGEQCDTFWTTAKISDGSLLRDWVIETGTKAYFIALVGYKKSVEVLRTRFPELSIICAEYIDEHHQIFGEKNRCWRDNDEARRAEEVLSAKLAEHGISLRGHDNLCFAVALHKTIPDWSLPALFKNKNDWQHLLERKTTYD